MFKTISFFSIFLYLTYIDIFTIYWYSWIHTFPDTIYYSLMTPITLENIQIYTQQSSSFWFIPLRKFFSLHINPNLPNTSIHLNHSNINYLTIPHLFPIFVYFTYFNSVFIYCPFPYRFTDIFLLSHIFFILHLSNILVITYLYNILVIINLNLIIS